MSKVYPDRTSHQCKSHYQKLQKMTKNGSVFEIIRYLEKKMKKDKVLIQKNVKAYVQSDKSGKEKVVDLAKINIFNVTNGIEVNVKISDLDLSTW